jgi:hypothetical protein
MSRLPPRRRPSQSLDDTLIKLAAGVIVVALIVGGVHWYRAAQAADARAVAVEQERQQTLAVAAEARRIEQRRLQQLDADRFQQSQANAQAAMYKCRDATGVVAIQSWPYSKRTCDLIRQLDDYVYEACKGT